MLMTDIVNCWNPYRDWSKEQFSAHYLSHPLIIHSWHQKELLVQSVPKSGKKFFFLNSSLFEILQKRIFFLQFALFFHYFPQWLYFILRKAIIFPEIFLFSIGHLNVHHFSKKVIFIWRYLVRVHISHYEKLVEVNSTREFASPSYSSYILYTCSKISSVLLMVVGDWPAKF